MPPSPTPSPPLPSPLALQVGTSDGRVKLLGTLGVEDMVQTPSRAPTSFLAFLQHRGALLRVTKVTLAMGGEGGWPR